MPGVTLGSIQKSSGAYYPHPQQDRCHRTADPKAIMQMHSVISTNVQAVGYDNGSRTLRVQFQSGGIYDYYEVTPSLYQEMLQPHPWRRVGRTVKAHVTNRVA
ncbi:KTSC domain-containing protein [Clavibacter michiganensis]|uniref:KTSC domain-containing protein n=1 Tax=Clavibacter michiganensis TaxID=28447 RepID=UPI000A378ACE